MELVPIEMLVKHFGVIIHDPQWVRGIIPRNTYIKAGKNAAVRFGEYRGGFYKGDSEDDGPSVGGADSADVPDTADSLIHRYLILMRYLMRRISIQASLLVPDTQSDSTVTDEGECSE